MTTPVFVYSGHDYTAEYERLVSLLPDDYTDRNHSDGGITILRCQASTSDLIYAFGDYVAGESFVSMAQFKQSLVDHGWRVSYLPTIYSGALTRLLLGRFDPAGTDPISIPRYTRFTRLDGLGYLTLDAVTIATGEQSVQVDAIQGTLVELEVNSSDFRITDWTKHPRYNLGTGVAANTLELWHGYPAVTWLPVDSFWRSWPEDRHFLLQLNGDTDEVWLVTGNGTKGSLLPASTTISLRFVRTDADEGNCGTGVITGVPDAFAEIITCTNIEIATGGAQPEDLESIRNTIPAMTRTQNRCVTKEDYEARIEHLPGVLHCQSLDRSDDKQWPHEYVVLYVVPDGGGPMPTELQEQIWAECGSWGMYGSWRQRYLLFDAIEKPVDIAVRIGVLSGYVVDTVLSAVRAALLALLAPQNRTIGGTLTFAELHLAVSKVPGVSCAEFDAPNEDTRTGNGEFIVPGTISVTAQ